MESAEDDIETQIENETGEQAEDGQDSSKNERLLSFPLTRIKNLMKLDPDVTLASHDAAVMIAKAVELFVTDLAKEASNFTAQSKRKTVHRKDVDAAINGIDSLAFLEDAYIQCFLCRLSMSAKRKSKKSVSTVPSPERGTETNGCDSQFETISTPQKSAQQGNLTGPERKVKDSCADWHNYAEKWKILILKGGDLVTQISNLKIASFDDDNSDSDELFGKLEILSEQLVELHQSLQKLVSKMNRLTECFGGLLTLSSEPKSSFDILFQSWPIDRYLDASRELCLMYQKELSLKKCIVENVCHSESREMAMFQISAWLHDPYIDKYHHDFLIESMLVEVGLK